MSKDINTSVFRPSFWDSIPFKRNDFEKNYIINPEYRMNLKAKLALPLGFRWVNLDISKDVAKICDFLNKWYKVHHNKIYKANFLQWIMNPPWKHFERLNENNNNICLGVETTDHAKLVAFISARPISYVIDDQLVRSYRVDYLCVHPQLRKKKLAIVLIKELYRRISELHYDIGIFFNTYRHLPFKSIVETTHVSFRPLNIEKLSKSLFKGLSPENIKKLQNLYENIQPTADLNLIRSANVDDVPIMMEIYNRYAETKRIYQVYNQKEFEYQFLPRNELVYTYVITNKTGMVKDFVSLHAFYTKTGEKNAFVYFISFINEILLELFMRNVLYIMKSNGFDMIYANNIMGIDKTFANKLLFKPLETFGDYYIFNYNSPQIQSSDCLININM